MQTGSREVRSFLVVQKRRQPGFVATQFSSAPSTGSIGRWEAQCRAKGSSTQRGRPGRRLCSVLWSLVGYMLIAASLSGCARFISASKNAEGVRLLQQAKYQEALTEFQQAARIDPQNADSFYNLAAAYHRLAKLENRPSYLEQAELLYQQCLDRDSNHVDCHRGLAVLLCEQGRSQEALRLLEGWVERQPRSPDARIELARLYDELGNKQAATEELLASLAIDANNPRALTALGKLREEAGQHAQALENYTRSLARDNRQPAVAARIAALQAIGGGASAYGASSGTRLVDRQPAPLR